jgi:hypothetical protein
MKTSKHPGFEKVLDRENRAAGVHIKPTHKGLLHEDLGIPEGQPIPMSRIKKAEHSADPAERKRAQFADNFHHEK